MKFVRSLYLAGLVACLSTATAHAGREDFDADKMLSDLETQLDLSGDKLSKVKPVLREKSEQTKNSINNAVDKGFMELETLAGQLDTASKEAGAKLKGALNSEEMQQLKSYLAKMDGQAIEEIRAELVAKLTEFLKLTEEQVSKLKPALEDGFDQLGEMLDELVQQGGKSVDEFRQRYDKLSKDLEKKLEDALDGDQLEYLHEHRQELRESINATVFSA